MRILMATHSGEISYGNFLRKGFQSLGHQVIAVGPGHNAYKPDFLYGPDESIPAYNAERICKEQNCDFVLAVEPGGFFCSLEKVSMPNAIYYADTLPTPESQHVSPLGGREYLNQIDFIFAARMNHAALWRKIGYKAYFLPLAYDPAYHFPVQREKLYDIVFVGRIHPDVYPERVCLLNTLKEANFSVWYGQLVLEQYCEKIAEGRIALNNSHDGELNMRFFELLGMGAFQLCNIVIGQESLGFYPREHLMNYTDRTLVEICREFLADDKEREKIAEAGYQKAKSHTYKDRAEQILKTVFGAS